MPHSSDVSDGDQPTPNQYNYLRDDALRLFASTGSELTISSGAITVSYESFYDVDTAGDASTDDLDTISGGSEGDIIILRAENAARTVIVKHNTGNIHLKGEKDCPLVDQTQLLMLRYDGSDWVEISAGANRLALLGAVLGGGLSIILQDTYVDIPYVLSTYILGYYVVADQSGSLNIDLRTDTFGNIPDSADSVQTSPAISLSSQQTKSDTTLTSWTREQAGGKTWRFIATGDATSIQQASILILGVKL